MGYCTRIDITRIIAQSLTSATAPTSDDLGTVESLMSIGNTLDRNLVTDDIVDYYIQLADREIDATLSELYATPFCELTNFETELFADIDEHNNYIMLERSCPLAVGDNIILIEGDVEERHVIEEVVTASMYATEDDIQYMFAAGTRLVRVSFPNPIGFISARLGAANIYDKYFSAEVSPATSEFGERLRELSMTSLNNILNGTTILHGQHRIGRRFYEPNLVDQYGLPTGGTISKEMRQVK